MNSPAKFQISKVRTSDDLEELAKWHCILNLFAEATGNDPFLVKNIKEAIDASLNAEEGLDSSIDHFAEAALRLAGDYSVIAASYGLYHLDLRERGFDPLFARTELLAGLKRIAGYQKSLVIVTGLRQAIAAPGHRLTARRRAAYEEAKAYIDSVAAEWTTANTSLTILYT